MDKNAPEGSKGGYTIQELQDMWQKYVVEIGVGVIFALTAIFTLIWGGAMLVWSILLAMIFGIIGVVFAETSKKITSGSFHFISNRDKITSIVMMVIGAIVSIFLPCVIFAIVGFIAGHSIHFSAYKKELSDSGQPSHNSQRQQHPPQQHHEYHQPQEHERKDDNFKPPNQQAS